MDFINCFPTELIKLFFFHDAPHDPQKPKVYLITIYICSKIIFSRLLSSLHVSVICDAISCVFPDFIYIYFPPPTSVLFKWSDCNNFNTGIYFYCDTTNHIMIVILSSNQGNTQSRSKTWTPPSPFPRTTVLFPLLSLLTEEYFHGRSARPCPAGPGRPVGCFDVVDPRPCPPPPLPIPWSSLLGRVVP